MTSHPTVGLSRPHLRAPSRTTSQTHVSFSSTPSKHALIDLTDTVRPTSDGEAPSKRRKTDKDGRAVHGGLAAFEGDGSGNSPRQPSRPGRHLQFADQQAQTHFQTPTASLSSNITSAVPDGPKAKTHSLPPLPMRPGGLAPARSYRQRRMTGSAGASGREAVPVKPYVAEPPPFAPHFERNKVADFFPWAGNHPEDVLSEHVTKQGFFDKTQISHESNTARPSLYSIFKHKSGLQTLSTLFVSALEQRQAHGRVSAGSTFKPPPRVTLTDTKREAWLKDLANSAVPLRRLSRTIPHGIRGKILLDQCLSKNIPTGRAVWLAKCVGANEIRAFKRKGTSGAFAMGGETKWIKDWTACVEQFLDGVVGACGAAEWKKKMNYAIRVSAHLYSEHLLDREHYLDWVLASFGGSSLDTVPVWLLVLQIGWKDLIGSRKYGRHVAETLLEKLELASVSEKKGLYVPIVRRLSELIRDLMNSSAACFIMPTSWARFEGAVKSCLNPQNRTLISRFDHLVQRNKHLMEVGRRHKGDLGQSPREQLIRNLDSLRAPFDVRKVSEMCLGLVENHDTVIDTLLQWISTPYRADQAHIYLTVRLVRKWNKLGHDTDKPILGFLARSRGITGLRKYKIYQVVVELVRSMQFSVGRYCQWLLAKGAMSGRDSLHKDAPCDLRLLAELPLYSLPEYSVNLRAMLLSGASFSIDEERHLIEDVEDAIRSQCVDVFDPIIRNDLNRLRLDEIKISDLSWTVKTEISRWLRQVIASSVQTGDTITMNDWKDIDGEKETSVLSVEQLWFVRCILEGFEDFSILADVLKITSTSTNQEVLTSIADTINYHFDVFSAIGAASDLFGRLIEQNRSVTANRHPSKPLLVSLIDLGAHFPTESQTVQQLCGQLALCEQKSAAAACSPVSDHIAEALQSAESNFSDEFEQLLTSGTSMDKQTMARLFATIMKRVEYAWNQSDDEINNLAVLCSRLRVFDTKHFDNLMLVWLESLLVSRTRPELHRALLPLISAGCLSFRAVVTCSKKLVDGAKQDNTRSSLARVMVDVLDLIVPLGPSKLSPMNQAIYRFRLEQRRFSIARPFDTVFIIGQAIGISSTSAHDDVRRKLKSLLASSRVLSLLRYLVVHHTVMVQDGLFLATKQSSPAAASTVDDMINDALGATHANDLLGLDPRIQVTRLIQLADEFSLPFYQLKLRQVLQAQGSKALGNADDSQTGVVTALFEGVKTAVADDNKTWPMVLSVVENTIACQIREHAEELLFSSMITPNSSRFSHDDTLGLSKLNGQRYLSIIQALAYTIPESGSLQIGQILSEKMSVLAQSLQSPPPQPDTDHAEHLNDNEHNQQLNYISFWVNTLLRITLLHLPTLHNHSNNKTTPTPHLLLSLSTLLLSPSLAPNAQLLTSIFDTLSTLLDTFTTSDPTRTTCIRVLKANPASREDPRLRFLFGYDEAEAESQLRVETRGKVGPVYNLKWWEVIQDPAPVVGENDTFVSLGLFGARKVL